MPSADLILHIYIFSRHGATLTFIWSRPTSKWKSLFLFCFLVLRKTFGSLATKCSAVFSGCSPCLPVSRWCSVQWLCWCKVVVHPIKLSKPLTVYKDGTSWSPPGGGLRYSTKTPTSQKKDSNPKFEHSSYQIWMISFRNTLIFIDCLIDSSFGGCVGRISWTTTVHTFTNTSQSWPDVLFPTGIGLLHHWLQRNLIHWLLFRTQHIHIVWNFPRWESRRLSCLYWAHGAVFIRGQLSRRDLFGFTPLWDKYWD